MPPPVALPSLTTAPAAMVTATPAGTLTGSQSAFLTSHGICCASIVDDAVTVPARKNPAIPPVALFPPSLPRSSESDSTAYAGTGPTSSAELPTATCPASCTCTAPSDSDAKALSITCTDPDVYTSSPRDA